MSWVISGIATGLQNVWYGNTAQATPSNTAPKTVDEVFRDAVCDLSNNYFRNMEKGQQDCIDKCVSAVSPDLQKVSFPLSGESEAAFELHFHLFSCAVDAWRSGTRKGRIPDADADRLKTDFQRACFEKIRSQWITSGLQQFHGHLSISDPQEMATVLFKWTREFFCDAGGLAEWETEPYSRASRDIFNRALLYEVEESFRALCSSKVNRNMELLMQQGLRDPIAFNRRVGVAIAQAKENPSVLSKAQKDALESVENFRPSSTTLSSLVDKRVELLANCLEKGNLEYFNKICVAFNENMTEHFAKMGINEPHQVAARELVGAHEGRRAHSHRERRS